MRARSLWAPSVLLVSSFISSSVAGCGLALDTDPPDQPSTLDGGSQGGLDGGGQQLDAGGGAGDAAASDAAIADDASVGADGAIVACAENVDCDDGLYCNGQEQCVSGTCAAGEPPCDPGFGCVTFACDETSRACVPGTTASACPAPLVCRTTDGACVECLGDADCAELDGVPCTVPACDATTGTCSEAPSDGACGDPVGYTRDLCMPGAPTADVTGCVHVPDDALCTGIHVGCGAVLCVPGSGLSYGGTSGCVPAPDSGACSDGQRCVVSTTTGLTCMTLPFGCTGCDDLNPCNGVEGCDPGTMRCVRLTDGCPPAGPCTQAWCGMDGAGTPACMYRPIVGCVAP